MPDAGGILRRTRCPRPTRRLSASRHGSQQHFGLCNALEGLQTDLLVVSYQQFWLAKNADGFDDLQDRKVSALFENPRHLSVDWTWKTHLFRDVSVSVDECLYDARRIFASTQETRTR